MSKLHSKLKSNTGASMVIALMFLLLCGMVGGVVLTASSVDAGKTGWDRAAYQKYLAVSSAAELVSKDLQNLVFQGTWKKVETETITLADSAVADGGAMTETRTEQEENLRTDDSDGEKATGFIGSSRLIPPGSDSSAPVREDFLAAFAELYYGKQGIAELEGPFFGELPVCRLNISAAGVEEIPEVSGTLSVDEDYQMTVVLHEKSDENTDAVGGNPLTLTFAPVVSLTTVAEDTSTSPNGDTVSETVTTTYYITTISWEKPIVTGGGAP